MNNTIMYPFRASALAGLLLASLLWVSVPAGADELKAIAQLANQGQHAQALDKVNSYLAAHPKDVQGLFLKGVILAEQNKSADAIKIFTEITDKHPELPEPYNNLAVLYADQGQYDKARNALEMAIKTHPSYATAHENLGDIYAKMASDAYDRALQLDKSNSRAQTKLAMIKELFSGVKARVVVAKPEEPQKTAAAAPATAAPAPAAETPKPAKPAAPAVVAQKEPEKAAEPAKQAKPAPPAAPAVVAQKEPEKIAEKPAAPVKDEAALQDDKDAALEAVQRWASAWSAQNIDDYLAAYAESFKTPNGESRSDWEKMRKERVSKPASIKVEVLNPKIKTDGSHVIVSFHQTYRAGGNSMLHTQKTLVLKKINDKWLIEREQAREKAAR